MRALLSPALVIGVVAALALSGCAGDEEEPTGDEPTDEVDEGEDGEDDAAAPEDAEPVEFGFIPWDEAIAVTNLWQVILEEEGYEVNQTQLEVGGLYAGLAEGDLDLFMDAWLPATHEDYMEEFGDELEEVGVWFEEAPLTWTVPEYVDVDSIEELPDNVDQFDGEIIGIEPGAGLTRISQEEVIPTYGLEEAGFEFIEGSTPAMLTALEDAIANEEPVLVTLWHPHWAYGEFDLKDLEDPENALGDPDEIRTMGKPGFSDEYPQVAEWIGNFEMSLDELSELEVMINEADEPIDAAREWYEQNQDRVEEWTG